MSSPALIPIKIPSLRNPHAVQLSAFLLDNLHASFHGNKSYKLKNLELASGHTLLTFGGIWSNHLWAVANYCQQRQWPVMAVVRNPNGQATPLLSACERIGMRLHSVDYSQYRQRYDTQAWQVLSNDYGPLQLLPEGGSCARALQGCEQIGLDLLAYTHTASHVVCAMGTACTVAGIRRSLPTSIHVTAVATTKKYAEQYEYLTSHCGTAEQANWCVQSSLEWGAYGQVKPLLAEFIVNFEQDYGIMLDPNYSARAFAKTFDNIKAGVYPPKSHVIVVHTGGLVGRLGYPEVFSQSPLGVNPLGLI